MDMLISDLLEFVRTRLGSGIPLAPTACDVGTVCSTALEVIRAGNPEHCFEQQLSGDLSISADAPRLHQALLNLLSNAVQHGDRDRTISLIAVAVEEGIEVRVTNFGRPIPESSLQMIFEPMVRAASPEVEMHDHSKTSLGLGLFIVREIVGGHGGTVTVQSSVEAGTAFTIRLPRAHEAAGVN